MEHEPEQTALGGVGQQDVEELIVVWGGDAEVL
jgi:hypothetical protein